MCKFAIFASSAFIAGEEDSFAADRTSFRTMEALRGVELTIWAETLEIEEILQPMSQDGAAVVQDDLVKPVIPEVLIKLLFFH